MKRLLLALLLGAAAPVSAGPLLDLARDDEPVIVIGGALPALAGRAVADIALYRYDPGTSSFVPIPFQIDERVDHVFNPGTASELHEPMYDVFGEENGTLDADDEVAFLFGDGGPTAPAGAPWPAGADPERFQITVTDTRPGAPAGTRTAYAFTGAGLPRSPVSYVSWSGTSGGDVVSSRWSIEFSDRWVLDGYRVLPPCGSGADVIDRVKGRAGPSLGLESEQEWNLSSTFLGGLVGPVRAIRYVRGAASGTNTTHHDVIYRGYWERTVNLRVHAIAGIALYLDLRPRAGTTVFTSRTPSGAAVDGAPDTGVAGSFVPWAVISGPDGGYAVSYDVPPSPHYTSKLFYYRDDLTYNDAVSAFYDDEDNASYGAQGVELRGLDSTEQDALPFTFRFMPLCGGAGDAATGAGFQAVVDAPLAVSVLPQANTLGAVTTLRAAHAMGDVVLTWDPVPGATSYRVYTSSSPGTPHASWTVLGDVVSPAYVDAGGAGGGSSTFYSVVALSGTQEGSW